MSNIKNKFICSNCVDDEFIKSWIHDDGKVANCDYCGDENDCVELKELCDWVDNIYREHYQPGEEYPSFFGGDKPEWVMAGSTPDEIIGEMLSCEEEIVIDVLSFLSEEERYDVAKDAATPYYDEGWCYEETPIFDFEHSDLWDSFCHHVKHKSRFFSTPALDLLNELFSGISEMKFSGEQAPIRTVDLNSEDKFVYRARAARTDYERIKLSLYPVLELGPPPKNKAVAGRMNPAGISVFYGAFDAKTCLSELRLPVGDMAISGKFEIIKPLVLMDLSRFNRLYEVLSIFDPDFSSKASQLKFLRRFENEVRKPVLPSDELLGYIPTQALVEYLANYHTPRIDGLIYSSTQTNGDGKNIVIFNHAAHIASTGGNDSGKEDEIYFEISWPQDSISYSIYETDDKEKGINIKHQYVTEEKDEPSLKLVDDEIEVHLINGIEHSYDSDKVRITYQKDLENLEF